MTHDLQDLTAQLRALVFAVDDQRADEQLLSSRLGEALTAAGTLLRVDGAGLMLLDEQDVLRVIGVSDQASAVLEYAQERAGAGPGIDCVRTGRSVAVGDLADDHPYPRLWDFLTAEKSQVPFRAVLSVPVVVGDEVAGTFNVMSTGPWQWKSGQAEAVEAYAAVIAVLLRLGVAAQQRSVPFRPRLRDEDD